MATGPDPSPDPVVRLPYRQWGAVAKRRIPAPRPARRRRQYHETPDFLLMIQRQLAAAGKRVAEADPDQLRDLIALSEHLEAAVWTAVAGQRATGITWQSLGEETGTTRQAAIQKWGPGATPPALLRTIRNHPTNTTTRRQP